MSKNLLGIGTDILAIKRFSDVVKKHGQVFLDRILTPAEQEYCQRYQNPLHRYAARFCAKEAVVKALGVGFGKHIGFLDIEILRQEEGRPHVTLSKKCQKYFQYPEIHLSISHCDEYATATAIVYETYNEKGKS